MKLGTLIIVAVAFLGSCRQRQDSSDDAQLAGATTKDTHLTCVGEKKSFQLIHYADPAKPDEVKLYAGPGSGKGFESVKVISKSGQPQKKFSNNRLNKNDRPQSWEIYAEGPNGTYYKIETYYVNWVQGWFRENKTLSYIDLPAEQSLDCSQ